MGLFSSTEFHSLDDLFLEQIEDLYDAEHRIRDGLTKMRDASTSSALKAAYEQHLRETEGQIGRLEHVFQALGKSPERETCEAAKGLIREGSEMIDAQGDPAVRDAGIIAAAQRIEHYEIAGYGTARTLAQQLGHAEAARLLEQTLEEEKGMDDRLTDIAETSINPTAAVH